MKTKYALYKYTTENVGDEIQSIAARRFLPQIDYYIDRDSVGQWRNQNKKEAVKLIANAWYMHSPFAWPPKDPTIDPLLISVFIAQLPDAHYPDIIPKDIFLTDASKKYLQKHGPVGSRDYATMKLLQENGIDAYFSGCLTLTLQKDPYIAKKDYILAVDISDELYDFLKTKTDRQIIRMSPYGDYSLNDGERFAIAEYYLATYQRAHAIVSTRLHATLPALAFETPVFLIKRDGYYDKKRYSGLGDLARSATEAQYMDDYSLFDLDNPGDNPDDYLPIRNELIKKCSDFTGFNDDKSFMRRPITSANVSSIFDNDDVASAMLGSYSKRWEVVCRDIRINNMQHDIDAKEAYIQDLQGQLEGLGAKYQGLLGDYKSIKNSSPYYLGRTIFRKLTKKVKKNERH